jgi:hypothetical protein
MGWLEGFLLERWRVEVEATKDEPYRWSMLRAVQLSSKVYRKLQKRWMTM